MRNLFSGLSRLQQNLIIIIMALAVYAASSTLAYALFSHGVLGSASVSLSGAPSSQALPTTTDTLGENPNEPKTAQCPLNGSMHTKEAQAAWENRRPLAVMIENSVDARPQSGLSSADIVYEAVAEGGITRFMAIFYCNSLQDVQVGPVRSARTYFLDWVSEYDALYAHVGGANMPGPADALGQIITYGIKDLNQFSIGYPVYWRDYQRLGHPVATEHTMYSSTQKLWGVGTGRGWTATDSAGIRWDANFAPWRFKKDQPGSGTVTKITVPFWEAYSGYTVEWNYDQNCNCYKRKNGGADHIDFDNQQILSPKNIVVQFMAESHANDGYENNEHLLYADKGQGQALIFQDGKAIQGTWSKTSRLAKEEFYDLNHQRIEFNPGQIWIQTVPTGSHVTY